MYIYQYDEKLLGQTPSLSAIHPLILGNPHSIKIKSTSTIISTTSDPYIFRVSFFGVPLKYHFEPLIAVYVWSDVALALEKSKELLYHGGLDLRMRIAVCN